MSNEYIVNARIEDTMFGIEDHGIMTFMLFLSFEDSGQGFGGYALDGKSGTIGHSKSIPCIRKILETVDVLYWEKLKGQLIRIKKESYSGPIVAIGHIMDDRWFDIKEFFTQQ
jgi:hypothetical protein